MADYKDGLEAIKIYRESARHYFNARSNVTYVNIVGFGAIAAFITKTITDVPMSETQSVVESRFWLIMGGLLVIVALSAWATSLCNVLSNAFFGYMRIVREIESDLKIPYPPPLPWATTYEFLSPEAQRETYDDALRGNVWNIANGFLGVSGAFMMIVISKMAHELVTFYCSGFAYAGLIVFLMYVSVKPVWVAVTGMVGILVLSLLLLWILAG